MRLALAILLLFSVVLANAGEVIVSLDYHHSMRIVNSHVRIVIDSEGILALTAESRGKDKATTRLKIPGERVQQLKRELEGIDWQKVSADKSTGLDGTTVRISIGKQSASLWSPDYDSKKRGLVRMQKLIESILAAAGRDQYGMPK